MAQYVGAAATFAFAFILVIISRHARLYRRYGTEALLCAAMFAAVSAGLRVLSIHHTIDPETARALTGLTSACALAILAQIALLRRKDQRVNGDAPTA